MYSTDEDSSNSRVLPPWFHRGYRIFGYFKYAGAAISAIALFGMMLWIVLDIFSRNVLGSSISGSFEITQNYFMPLAVFPGLAYVYASGILPRMNLLVPKRSYPVRKTMSLVLIAVEITVLGMLIVFTSQYALNGYSRQEAFSAGGDLWPVWPLYFAVPLGLLLVLVEVLFATARNIINKTATIEVHEYSPSPTEAS